ncbi:MAG: type II toxin-antitoxin system antitoxin SocA domain-containing protein, partial [Cyanobacteria bacterium J06555_12]
IGPMHKIDELLERQMGRWLVDGAYLLRKKKPLVSGYFEAWNYGPVHPAVYSAFKSFGEKPVDRPALRKDLRTGELTPVPLPADREVLKITRKVLFSLEDMTPGQLVKLSHARGGPWHQVFRRSKSEHMLGLRISNEAIRERYRAHWFPADNLESVDEPAEDSPLAYYRSGADCSSAS